MEKAKPSYRRSRLQQELWTVCVSTEGGILEGEGRICDTGKALDFPPLWFGTRRSVVQIHSPRPLKTLSLIALQRCATLLLFRLCSARSAIKVRSRFVRQLETESDLICPQLTELRILRQ